MVSAKRIHYTKSEAFFVFIWKGTNLNSIDSHINIMEDQTKFTNVFKSLIKVSKSMQ